MNRAVFDGVDEHGRGICLKFRLEPAYKGATRTHYSMIPSGQTVVFAADEDYGPMPELDDGAHGILFASDEETGAAEAFASFGYTAQGVPAAVRRRVTMVYEVAGTSADSKEAVVTRCLGGRYEPKVTIEIVGEEDANGTGETEGDLRRP